MTDFLAIFDVDGTLIDSQAIIHASMTHAFETVEMPPPARETVLRMVGLSLPRIVEALAPGAPEAVQDRILSAYRLRFAEAMSVDTPPPTYPGVEAGIARLQAAGIALGLATGKSRRGVKRLIGHMAWEAVFATVQCADHHPSKPHPSMIRRALAETAMDEGQAAMVGDTTFDVEMAVAAGIPALGVSWGYHEADLLHRAGATEVIDTFPALVDRIIALAEERAG